MVQRRQKQRYDSHRKEKSYNVGDLVLVYRPLLTDVTLFRRPLASVSRDSTERHVTLVTSEHDSVSSKPTPQLPFIPLPTPELMSVVTSEVPRVCAVGTDKTIPTVVRRSRSRLIYDNLRPRKGLAITDRLGIRNKNKKYPVI